MENSLSLCTGILSFPCSTVMFKNTVRLECKLGSGSLIQAQYAFIYHALLDYHKTGNTAIECSQLKEQYKELLADGGLYTNQTKLEEHFEVHSILD